MTIKETTRPTIYRTMKYWGKKPHNVWAYYIEKYSKKGDLILDPFVGSGMTYFESIKTGRNPITIDINPISDFVIKCLTKRNFDYEKLEKLAYKIIHEISELKNYKSQYKCKCSKCGNEIDINNYIIDGNDIFYTYRCADCKVIISSTPVKYKDTKYKIKAWIPTKKLSCLNSINENFIEKVGGDCISNLWTNRNLFILSEIYSRILKIDDNDIKDLLVLSFLETLHLTSKMCIPRGGKSNRPLSTSWGRPAYMISNRIYEQNPLLTFKKSIFNKSGVISALKNSESYLGNDIKSGIHYCGSAEAFVKKIKKESIDLIITDPPYGGIIQYGDLSEVWVSWLEHYNNLHIDHNNEIIINNKTGYSSYTKKLTSLFVSLNNCLKKDGKFILTFNSGKRKDWNSLINSIYESGFKIDTVTYQKNRRSSEANVSAKEGIAISDYYLICSKGFDKMYDIGSFLNKWGIVVDGE